MVEVLGGEGIAARLDTELADLAPSVVHVATGSVEHGFIDPALKLAVLTETDLTGQKSPPRTWGGCRPAAARPSTRSPDRRRLHRARTARRRPLRGDVQRTVQGATREYLVVEYAPAKRGQPGDRLFVPTDQLEQVTKYVGGEAPSLHRLGGADWTKTKARCEEGGQGDRRRPDPAVLGPDGGSRVQLRAGHALAAGAGGRVPVRGRRLTS